MNQSQSLSIAADESRQNVHGTRDQLLISVETAFRFPAQVPGLHHLLEQVAQLKVQSAVQRVAEFLVSLCPIGKGPFAIALPYDKILIAGRLGIKPESLSRVFATLRSAGVEVHALQVIVHDVGALRRVATGNRRSRRLSVGSA